MKTSVCDICGAKDTELVDLLETWQTKDIKQICPACERAVNDKLWALRSVTHGILKTWLTRFMEQLRK